MKTIRLLIVALLVVSTASAQSYSGAGNAKEGEYSPTVYLISVHETDTIYTNEGCDAAMEAAALNRLAVESAIQDYRDTHRLGFQQVEKPQFIFTTKNNKFSFAVGGTSIFAPVMTSTEVSITSTSYPTTSRCRRPMPTVRS